MRIFFFLFFFTNSLSVFSCDYSDFSLLKEGGNINLFLKQVEEQQKEDENEAFINSKILLELTERFEVQQRNNNNFGRFKTGLIDSWEIENISVSFIEGTCEFHLSVYLKKYMDENFGNAESMTLYIFSFDNDIVTLKNIHYAG